MTARRRTSSKPASDYGDWAGELTDSHLLCRDIGHSWRPAHAGIGEGGAWERVLRCQRCRTERQQTVQRDGAVYGNSYSYPVGYLAPKGLGAYDSDARSSLRLASLQRLVGTLSPAPSNVTPIKAKSKSKRKSA
jgi:hypothetical protein